MDILTGIIIAAAASIFTLLGKELLDKWKQRLSPYERKILIMAAECQGEIRTRSTDQTGRFVMIGPDAVIGSPVVQAAGLEALEKLITKGFVIHQARMSYSLTESGFRMAKKLGANVDIWDELQVNDK